MDATDACAGIFGWGGLGRVALKKHKGRVSSWLVMWVVYIIYIYTPQYVYYIMYYNTLFTENPQYSIKWVKPPSDPSISS